MMPSEMPSQGSASVREPTSTPCGCLATVRLQLGSRALPCGRILVYRSRGAIAEMRRRAIILCFKLSGKAMGCASSHNSAACDSCDAVATSSIHRADPRDPLAGLLQAKRAEEKALAEELQGKMRSADGDDTLAGIIARWFDSALWQQCHMAVWGL